jgi:hypothetical protein
MQLRLATLLGVLVLVGACGEDPVAPPAPDPTSGHAASTAAQLPSLIMLRGSSTWRCEASAAPRPGDPVVEVVVQGEDGRILARGPADEPLVFDLAPTTRGRISTIARYASGTELRRDTLLP